MSQTNDKAKVLHRFSCKFFSWCIYNFVCCFDLLVCWSSFSVYFVQSIFKREKGIKVIFKRHAFNIGVHENTSEPISFKLCLLMNTAKLQLDTSLNDLDIQGHTVTREEELVESFCCKVAGYCLDFCNDYVRKMTAKSLVIMANLSICSSCLLFFITIFMENSITTKLSSFFPRYCLTWC